MENNLKCPKCNSENLTADKKGFSGKKAVAGAVLTGGIGILAGTIGSNNMIITCLNCGLKYKASDYRKEKEKYEQKRELQKKAMQGNVSGIPLIILTFVFLLIGLWASVKLFINGWDFFGTIFAIATFLVLIFFIFIVKDESKRKQ